MNDEFLSCNHDKPALIIYNAEDVSVPEQSSSPKTKQELRDTISDNRDQGVDDNSYENSQGGEHYIESGDYEITANNAENILENPEREAKNFLSQYGLQYNGSCWEKYKFDNKPLR